MHASAAQALRRPPPSDATEVERFRDKLLLVLGHRFFLWVAILWLSTLCGFVAFVALVFGALYLPQVIAAAKKDGDWDGKNANAIGMQDEELKEWANICIQVGGRRTARSAPTARSASTARSRQPLPLRACCARFSPTLGRLPCYLTRALARVAGVHGAV